MQNNQDCREPGRKWSCDYCTFWNWPSSTKCTMCRAQKPSRVIPGQDIYSLDQDRGGSPACLPAPTDHQEVRDRSLDPAGKWSCPCCTYLNLSRSVRCTQCLSARKRLSPALSRNSPGSPRSSPLPGCQSPPGTTATSTTISNVNMANAMRSLADQLQPLHISVTSSNTGNRTPSPETRKKDAFGQEAGSAALSSPVKWPCLVCTYENWPRAALCVLCGARRGRTSPDHQQQALATARDSPSPEGASMQRPADGYTIGGQQTARHGPHTRHNQQHEAAAAAASGGLAETAGRITTIGGSGGGGCSSGVVPGASSPGLITAALAIGSGGGVVSAGGGNAGVSSGCGSPSSGGDSSNNNLQYEKRLRQLRRRMREADWAWVSACMGVVEGDACPVEAYLNSGGDPTRKLTAAECSLLARPGVYEIGHTLVHLAVKLHREDLLATLLSQMEGLSSPSVKRVPSYVAPDLAAAIRRQLALSLRHRKGGFPCYYLSDCATYTLPPEIEDLPRNVQEQLMEELLDKDAKNELESELCINWSEEITCSLGSRLYPLWNRSAGDCLLDAALQATYGVFDRDNMLRRAIADSLTEAGHVFYPRWKEWETRQAQELHFSLADSQWAADWADLLSLASQPGAALEQTHIFCLAHVLRRPIIVYGIKYVKSWRGENLGYAKFEGVYLPLLWDPSFCYRSPIALGYTRGHFCALVPPEPDPGCGGGAGGGAAPPPAPQCCYLPLVGRDLAPLPLHFLARSELGREEELLKQWLDVGLTESGVMVALQTINRPPLLVAQMTEEWLNYYRKIAQSTSAPVSGRNPLLARIQLSEEEESTDDD